ncbi:MAG: CD1845 family protein [Clostridiales bacterium]|nr:CD1845 family protein [Clostridiales bacterium]
MKTLLKIILLPITLVLNILLGLSKFVLVFGSGLLSILSFLLFVLGIGTIIVAGFSQAIPAFIAGYLISPWGLPMIGAWIIARVEYFNDLLKGI